MSAEGRSFSTAGSYWASTQKRLTDRQARLAYINCRQNALHEEERKLVKGLPRIEPQNRERLATA